LPNTSIIGFVQGSIFVPIFLVEDESMDDDELDVEEIMSCTPIDIQLGFASPLAHVGNLF
jgi:hypothetical protein